MAEYGDPQSELREKLAAIEHERWSDWQKWMHSKMVEHSDGKGEYVCLPVELFNRWERQIATDYKDLTEQEKQSDRDQVDRYWHLIENHLTAYHKAVVEGKEFGQYGGDDNKWSGQGEVVPLDHLNTIAKQHGLTQQHSDEQEVE